MPTKHRRFAKESLICPVVSIKPQPTPLLEPSQCLVCMMRWRKRVSLYACNASDYFFTFLEISREVDIYIWWDSTTDIHTYIHIHAGMHAYIQQPQHIYIHQDLMIFIDLYLLIIMEYKYVYIPRYNIRPLYTVLRDILVKVHRSKYITPVNL